MRHISLWAQSWMIVNSFELGLTSVFLILKREVVHWIISGLITPLTFPFLSLLLLVIFGAAEEIVSPSGTTTQSVPVCTTVNRGGADAAPEDPSHFTDHPDVRLSHIVRDVKHHCF